MSGLSKVNLFKYATSELSQDAFICWLVAHANENVDGISDVAEQFIKKFFKDYNRRDYIVELHRQYKRIDVLMLIKERKDYKLAKAVIIEDKTYTGTHNNQINRYKEVLIKEGIKETAIMCVYYKIVEQDKPEPYVDCQITRRMMIDEILLPYVDKVNNNAIYVDYLEYLQSIDEDVNSWKYKSIEAWTSNSWRGFFTYLTGRDNDPKAKVMLVKNRDKKHFTQGDFWDYGWGYVANPSGGFWGLWWYPLANTEIEQLKKVISAKGKLDINGLYLQIEKKKNNEGNCNVISLKLSMGNKYEGDKNKLNDVQNNMLDLAQKLREICMQHLDESCTFIKKAPRKGKTTSVFSVVFTDLASFNKCKVIMESVVDNLINWVEINE